MKIAVAIPNHNQHEMIYDAIYHLYNQSVTPSHIYVLSDDRPFVSTSENVICINNTSAKGRCSNRNSVITPFIDSTDDVLIFIDGDCYPKDVNFIEEYMRLAIKHDLMFCMREHTPITSLVKPASDLLTANMDNLWLNNPIDYTDLRIASGAVLAWQTASTFNERLDLMLTGMIGWSCNFAITRTGLKKYLKFMKRTYGISNELFDSKAFSHGWGYEDVAMGIDALYAGLDIWAAPSPVVCHRSHERSDGLFDHVKGRHMIMERYRRLNKRLSRKKTTIAFSTAMLCAAAIGSIITAIL